MAGPDDPTRRLTVAEVMTTDVVTVSTSTPVKEAAGLMSERRIAAIPVIGADGTLVGIISETDFIGKRVDVEVVGELMSAPVVTARQMCIRDRHTSSRRGCVADDPWREAQRDRVRGQRTPFLRDAIWLVLTHDPLSVGSSEKDVTASYRDGILEIRSALASPPAAKPVAHLAIKH